MIDTFYDWSRCCICHGTDYPLIDTGDYMICEGCYKVMWNEVVSVTEERVENEDKEE